MPSIMPIFGYLVTSVSFSKHYCMGGRMSGAARIYLFSWLPRLFGINVSILCAQNPQSNPSQFHILYATYTSLIRNSHTTCELFYLFATFIPSSPSPSLYDYYCFWWNIACRRWDTNNPRTIHRKSLTMVTLGHRLPSSRFVFRRGLGTNLFVYIMLT